MILLALASRAGAQPGTPAPGGSRVLYLFAEGDRSALTERYLRALCGLVEREPALNAQFDTVSVLRGVPEALDIGRQLNEDPSGSDVELSTVRSLSSVMLVDAHRCWSRPAPSTPTDQSNTTSHPVNIVRVVGIRLEAFGEELRAQGLELVPTASGNFARRVDAPEYLDLPSPASPSADHVALELALRFLLPAERPRLLDRMLVTPRPEIQLDAADRCVPGNSDCASIGALVTAHLALASAPPWALAQDVEVDWHLECGDRGERVEVLATIQVGSVMTHRARTRLTRAGNCALHARVNLAGERRDVSTEVRVDVPQLLLAYGRPAPSACNAEEGWWPADVVPIRGFLREIRLLPFLAPWSNSDDLAAFAATTSLVESSALTSRARELRDELIADYTMEGDATLQSAARRVLDDYLADLGDGLAYSLMRPCACEELDSAIASRLPAIEEGSRSRQRWLGACAEATSAARRELGDGGRRAEGTLFHAVTDAEPGVSVVPLGQVRSWRETEFVRTVPLSVMGTRQQLVWNAVTEGRQSQRALAEVHVHLPTPTVGALIGAQLWVEDRDNPLALGATGQFFLVFLDGAIRTDLSIMGGSAHGLGAALRLSAVATIELNAFYQLVAGIFGDAFGYASPRTTASTQRNRASWAELRSFPLFLGVGAGAAVDFIQDVPARAVFVGRIRLGLRAHIAERLFHLFELQIDLGASDLGASERFFFAPQLLLGYALD